MGLWWKEVNIQIQLMKAVTFSADRSAIPKSVPILWRYGQDWHCLQVMDIYDMGYRLMYVSPSSPTMQYRKVLRARFIMVRVGTEPVSFWIEDADGVPGELVRNGKMVPANRFRPDRSKPGSTSLELLEAMGQIAWV